MVGTIGNVLGRDPINHGLPPCSHGITTDLPPARVPGRARFGARQPLWATLHGMKRLLAPALGLGLAALTAGVLLLTGNEAPVLRFFRVNEHEYARASRLAAARLGPGEVRVPLDEATVRIIQPLTGLRVYEPHCYFHYRPSLTRKKKWSEHPAGEISMDTNSLGLRQDDEVAQVAPDLRVLVVGDSHLTGVCSNDETFAARLQARLAPGRPDRSVEVLNGAHGAYSFFHYLGVLERMLALGIEPDLFLVVVYGGNDHLGLNLWHFFQGTEPGPLAIEDQRARDLCADEHPAATGQVLNAAQYFARREGEEEVAHAMASRLMQEIADTCEDRDIGLLVGYLPAPTEVPGQAWLGNVHRGQEVIGVSDAEVARLGVMGDRLLRDLARAGLTTFDLRPPFRAHRGDLYWHKDLHLNVAGHDLAAQIAAPLVEAWWEARD